MLEKRSINIKNGVLLSIGGMIGSAVFSLSGKTIAYSGPWALFSWLIGGLILLGFGFCFAKYVELAGTKSARSFRFFINWAYIFGCISSTSFSASYIGMYFSLIFPGASGIKSVIAVMVVIVTLFLVASSIKTSTKLNAVLVVLLCAILLFYSFLLLFSGYLDLSGMFELAGDIVPIPSIAGSIPVAILAYGAIVAPAFLRSSLLKVKGSESRAVRLTMIISMALTIFLYCFAIFCTLAVIGKQQLPANMQFAPFNYALMMVGAPQIVNVILDVGAIFALFTTVIVVMRLGVNAAIEVFGESIERLAATEKVDAQALSNRVRTYVSSAFSLLIIMTILAGDFTNWIIDQGAIINVLFIALVCCYLGFNTKVDIRWRVLSFVIAVILVACYIPSILLGGWLIFVVSAVYMLLGALILHLMLRHA
ncbi:MAG: hypothetical protein LBQ41_01095 [Candidatus Ancillula sp.]|jgi:amino acid transporter|nr:hypothetical protein [Candidatus Ancillula sp.]